MMMKKLEKKGFTYTINLVALEGDGTFACPKCGTIISPDDESESNYKIVDTKVMNDELEELVISCNKCGSTIRITGFQTSINA